MKHLHPKRSVYYMGGNTLPRAEALAIAIERVWGHWYRKAGIGCEERIADK